MMMSLFTLENKVGAVHNNYLTRICHTYNQFDALSIHLTAKLPKL